MFERCPNSIFLFGENLRLWSTAGFCMIVVLSHIQTTLLLDLCNIQAGHFETIMFKNIFLNFGIGWMNTIYNFFQFQRVNFNVDMCICKFGQCHYRFVMIGSQEGIRLACRARREFLLHI